jgi:hypothetical protein
LGTCSNHPDRETSYTCLKFNTHMCEDCLECRDPKIYCKFRPSCAIHFLTKRKGNLDPEADLKKAPRKNLIGKSESDWRKSDP